MTHKLVNQLKEHKIFLRLYLTWAGKTGQELRDIKRNDKEYSIEKSMILFHNYIINDLKLSSNYANTAIGGYFGT